MSSLNRYLADFQDQFQGRKKLTKKFRNYNANYKNTGNVKPSQ